MITEPLESTITVSQLLRTLERSDAQCITIFRNGTGHFVMGFKSPAFQSLPELSKFVDDVTSRPPVAIQTSETTSTQTANAS